MSVSFRVIPFLLFTLTACPQPIPNPNPPVVVQPPVVQPPVVQPPVVQPPVVPPPLPAKRDFEMTAQCTTGGTSWTGARQSCDSERVVYRAIDRYVINERAYRTAFLSAAGSENRCDVSFGEYVETVPGTGLTAPKVIYLVAHARSPSGQTGARGWTTCKLSGQMVALSSP